MVSPSPNGWRDEITWSSIFTGLELPPTDGR
jgi:hypothetical protein